MDIKSCFILMPFSKSGDLNQQDLDYIYSHILKKAIEEYTVEGKKYFERVERFNNKVGSIINGIVYNLNTADLVIADLTGLNPNVMYELGVRHSLKKGTIIISQDLQNLPSDLRDYMTVGYDYSKTTTEQVAFYEKFKNDLHTTISEVINTNKYDSPVLSYLQQKQRFRNEDELDKLKMNTVIVDAICTEYYEVESLVENIPNYLKDNSDQNLIYQLFNVKLNNLSISLNELNISHKSSILYENIVNSKTTIAEVTKMFNMNEYFSPLAKLPDFPDGFMGSTDLKGCQEKKFVNLFKLTDEEILEYVTIRDLFKKEGIIDTELIGYLNDYIEEKAKELGVEENELGDLLKS